MAGLTIVRSQTGSDHLRVVRRPDQAGKSWTDPEVVLAHLGQYTHVVPELAHEAAERMGAALWG